jgi:hypothetical protein
MPKDEQHVITKLPKGLELNEKIQSIYIHRYENPLINSTRRPICKFNVDGCEI